MELKIEYLSTDDLRPYENNARKHADEDVDAIAASIKQFGFDDPIGIWSEDNLIVEGHGRLLAAKKLGMKTVPCIRLDHLSDEERRAYALAHNRTAELSGWDFDVRDEELARIGGIDMSAFGFDIEQEKTEEVVEDDFEVEVPEEPNAKRGQIYQLGRHRLMCGDSTDINDIDLLMGGCYADCVVTDPPYNMGYEGAGGTKDRKSKRIKNDKMKSDDFHRFLSSVFYAMDHAMKDGAGLYCFYKELGEGVFLASLRDAGLRFKQIVVWVKNQLVIGGSDYQNMFEPCIYGCKGKNVSVWNGKRKQRSVIESVDFMTDEDLRKAIRELTEDVQTDIIRENKPLVNDLHPTMKPIRLLARLVENSSNRDGVILDLFGGSGSTMIACEQLNRSCMMMELDERFVDVIINRWEQFTGRKAVLLNG